MRVRGKKEIEKRVAENKQGEKTGASTIRARSVGRCRNESCGGRKGKRKRVKASEGRREAGCGGGSPRQATEKKGLKKGTITPRFFLFLSLAFLPHSVCTQKRKDMTDRICCVVRFVSSVAQRKFVDQRGGRGRKGMTWMDDSERPVFACSGTGGAFCRGAGQERLKGEQGAVPTGERGIFRESEKMIESVEKRRAGFGKGKATTVFGRDVVGRRFVSAMGVDGFRGRSAFIRQAEIQGMRWLGVRERRVRKRGRADGVRYHGCGD